LEELHSNFKRLNQWNFKKKVSVKGMRHKAGGRKAGERRPVLSSAGIRAGANTVVQESPV
jgi:hypothetical protein